MKDNMTFEEATARLEEIVKSMENGKIPLEQSLSLFEEGVTLVKLCNELLDEAQQKVKILTEGADGVRVAADFNTEAGK
jgi:exodeoxyribonuclease VII small subunit